jgi:hypothetical protein
MANISRDAWVLLAPLPALGLGLLVATRHGVPWTAFLPNVLAVTLGILGAGLFLRALPRTRESMEKALPVAAFLGIALTLLASGLEGVHRWLAIGPVRLNMSATLVPWLALGVVASSPGTRRLSLVLLGATQLIHLAQPDAAQATALAAGALPVLAGGTVVTRRIGIPAAAALWGVAAATWSRPDPLPALAHVEGILALTASSGAPWALGAVIAGGALLAPFVLGIRTRSSVASQVGAGLALYLCASVAATFFGAFPVPVFGAGAGPVLGWYAMACGLGAARRHGARRGI